MSRLIDPVPNSMHRRLERLRVLLDAEESEPFQRRRYQGRTRAGERIQHDTIRRRDESTEVAHQFDRLNSRMDVALTRREAGIAFAGRGFGDIEEPRSSADSPLDHGSTVPVRSMVAEPLANTRR